MARSQSKSKEEAGAKKTKPRTAAEQPGEAEERNPNLPILYRQPVMLTPEAFAGKSFVRATDFAYAREAHMVPINASQTVDAAASYPILFTAGTPARIVAVLGLRRGENLFVEADGSWSEGHLIPDYVRRYPFILQRIEEPQGFFLCVDSASPSIVDGDAAPFYKDGEKTELLEEITRACLTYQRQSEITQTMAQAIAESGILAPHDDVYSLPGGRKIKLEGFLAIDKKKLDGLPDETFLKWRANGYLDFAYLHLVSLRNWPRLFIRLSHRRGPEDAATA